MAKQNEAKIKFTAETGQFNDQIKNSESTLRELRSELKLNASQMKKTGDNTKTLKERQAILKKELDASREKTQALSDKLEKAKQIFGENSEEAKKLQTQLNNAKTAEQKIANEIEDTNKALKNQETALEKVGKKAESAGEKLTNAGKKMSVVSAGIVAAGAGAVAAFNEVDEGADNVIKATGATGKAAEELEASYSKVAQSIVGDFDAIGATVGEINTRFGYTGGQLEKASLSFEKFATITGMDATEAVKAVSRAMNDAGIPLNKYDSLLDQLAKAGQSAGIDVAVLADSLSKNGSIMRSMGFDTEETIALLAQFELSGADASSMLTGMKRAMATWAEEGKNGNKEFAKTVEGIKNGSITASDALDIFGTKAGPMLVDAIKTGKFEYQDMLKVIQNSAGTVESTFDGTVDGGYQMELALQNAKVAAADVGDTLATSLVPIVEKGTEALKGFADWWSGLSDKQQKTALTIAGVVAAIGPLLIILGTLAGSISKIITLTTTIKTVIAAAKAAQIGATIATTAHTVATTIATAATTAFGVAMTILTSPITLVVAAIAALIAIIVLCVKNWDKIKAAGAKAWQGIKNAWASAGEWFRGVWSGIKGAFANVGGWFKEKFSAAKQGVQNAWSSVTSFFSNIKNRIVNGFSNIKEKLSAPFKSAIDKIKGFFNNLKLKFPKIKMPHFKITGKFSLDPPSVPKLGIEWYAKGGILTRPTAFGMNGSNLMVGGEAGPEAVLPIERLQSYVTTAVERTVQAQDLTPLVRAIENLAQRPVDLNIDGRKFATATAGAIDSVSGIRSTFQSRGLIID